MVAQVLELLDDAQAMRHFDLAARLEDGLHVQANLAHLAAGADRLEIGDPAGKRASEALAAHLAVGDDVDAGAGLVENRDLDRVVKRLAAVAGAVAAACDLCFRRVQPRRTAVRADDRGRQ